MVHHASYELKITLDHFLSNTNNFSENLPDQSFSSLVKFKFKVKSVCKVDKVEHPITLVMSH